MDVLCFYIVVRYLITMDSTNRFADKKQKDRVFPMAYSALCIRVAW